MEGVGARLGRSSTRYGPATVFTGPVRKWKKRWIPYIPPANHHKSAANGAANGANGAAHLVLYKWAPITPSQNGNGNGKSPVDDGDDADDEERAPKRKFKYIPVAVLEEQKNEASEPGDDEAKPMDIEADDVAPTSKSDDFDEKPDINDVPAEEENQEAHKSNPLARQDLNETLDLSLGLKAHDGEGDSDSQANQNKEG